MDDGRQQHVRGVEAIADSIDIDGIGVRNGTEIEHHLPDGSTWSCLMNLISFTIIARFVVIEVHAEPSPEDPLSGSTRWCCEKHPEGQRVRHEQERHQYRNHEVHRAEVSGLYSHSNKALVERK
jgi:hypothetical protein